ncbi:angiopoietin-related protein 6 [Paramormyrops kingsleyae]|uniref:Angiopoietin-like 6 n=1 Tax=Paramormyrops kingsleyae TaxID=1676925 RepID=A0A3B3T498_9TELE|nr:angiopoietin-related protein 2-like [Paramormyrops kingsleyae]
METWTLSLLFLTVLLVQRGTCGQKSIDPTVPGEEGTQSRQPGPAGPKAGRCAYTVVVPQQRLTGSLCITSRGGESGVANSSDVAALRGELSYQQRQLEEVRALVGRESGLAQEVRGWRGENAGLNARIAQLNAELLQQVLHSGEQALAQQRLQELLLNATTQVQQLTVSYRELENNYKTLTSAMSSQNALINRLEKQCQRDSTDLPQQGPRNESPETKKVDSDIQKDQSVSRDDPAAITPSPALKASLASFPVTKSPGPWRDCQHALDSGQLTSAIYLLQPLRTNRLLQAWCEQNQAHGGWTVIQRRQDGSVNFFRTWEQYKQGFGNLDGEYWLGLEHLYWLSAQAVYRLRVVLEDWQGRQVFAEYDSFRLEPESDSYRLRIGEYRGTAGDSLSWHNNKAFTTLDRDRDGYSGNCAHYQKGGWWYHMCAHSNLNGVWYRGGHYRSRYQDGVYWAEFHGGSYSLKKVAMMIKPT